MAVVERTDSSAIERNDIMGRRNKVDIYPLFVILVVTVLAVLLLGPEAARAKQKAAKEEEAAAQQAVEVQEQQEKVAAEVAAHTLYAPEGIDATSFPEYTGEPYVVVNGGVPYFTPEQITSDSYEYYGPLDTFGRCTVAGGCYGMETVPASDEERGDISSVKPTGFQQAFYDCVDDGDGDPNTNGSSPYINRCHLIAWCISAENANERNLITGTRYLNIDGMWTWEQQVQDYIYQHQGNHVMYRVTPIFSGWDSMAKGVLMEAYSVEDDGALQFCVYCYNVQPYIGISYSSGSSWYSGECLDFDAQSVVYPVEPEIEQEDTEGGDMSA